MIEISGSLQSPPLKRISSSKSQRRKEKAERNNIKEKDLPSIRANPQDPPCTGDMPSVYCPQFPKCNPSDRHSTEL